MSLVSKATAGAFVGCLHYPLNSVIHFAYE